ncbi:MAG: hypothetical protein B7X06_03985 [Verrucomicrobia bacterium 21-51-4]|nr:MAG: hypothetical protein B7X06_03985 [Verrucomicrobia bacterium 21-51-4]HQU09711.1 SAM-dependent methyltransferase [Opitutales bacterium]
MSKAPQTILSFAQFTEWALYDPSIGYYRQPKTRVGKSTRSDFYTSLALGPLFGELLIESMLTLLGPKIDPKQVTLLEIGAEPAMTAFSEHPFAAHYCIGYTTAWPEIKTPYQIRFSNELLDAQPFERIRFIENRWHLCGVNCGNQPYQEVLLPDPIPEYWSKRLPQEAQEGYTIDLPTGAQTLTEHLSAPNWQGLMLMIDYGLRWETLSHERPEGTARGYKEHQRVPHFLEHPAGSCDITHHIAWDLLQEQLQSNGFAVESIQSQESFLMHHAPKRIAKIFAEPSSARQTLQALLHPAHFGHKFQVLHAKRID